jgi:predicted SprT family Zn-dependent metalloprotease
MKLNDARQLASELIKKHDIKYTFAFDNAISRFGCCHHSLRQITLSKELTLANKEQQVKDTILHEIAHALAGAGNGHNSKWRRIALDIGCDGKRCYSSKDTINIPYSFVGTCPECARKIYRHRRTKYLACGKCCDKLNSGKYSTKYQVKWERINKNELF